MPNAFMHPSTGQNIGLNGGVWEIIVDNRPSFHILRAHGKKQHQDCDVESELIGQTKRLAY
jgi:hypothetical protein